MVEPEKPDDAALPPPDAASTSGSADAAEAPSEGTRQDTAGPAPLPPLPGIGEAAQPPAAPPLSVDLNQEESSLALAALPPADTADPFALGDEGHPESANESSGFARPLPGGGVFDDSGEEPAVAPPAASEPAPIAAVKPPAVPVDEEAEVVIRKPGESAGMAAVKRPGPIGTPKKLEDVQPSAKAPRKDPFLGRTLGGYEMAELIGHGGMGMVYRGEQVSLGREVAVKVLNKALVDNEEFLARFRREARAMAAIHHPNIVAVIDFGEHDGTAYMVAEFVRGTNLAKMIRDTLMVAPQELTPIIIQCLGALDHVSQSGIIHRDIKPDNILIDEAGTAKIADFGLAKDVNQDDTDLTAVGSAMGTPAYMSPEQCMGRKLDGRSDMYALGVTAYFALTGEKPFTGNSSFEIMTKQREHTPTPPCQLNPQIPDTLSALVMRMIEKRPADRFADAAACRDAWIQEGQRLGYFGGVTRSGEFYVQGADAASLAYPDEDRPSDGNEVSAVAAMPPAPPSPDSPDLRFPSDPNVPEPAAGLPPAPSPPSPAASAPRDSAGSQRLRRRLTPPDPGTESNSPASSESSRFSPPDDSTRGMGSEARWRKPRTSSLQRSQECDRCGHVNHAGAEVCEHCGAALSPGARAGDSEDEAARLLRDGKHRDSSRMYARLADSAGDRRHRSLLRAKEREARSKADDQQYNEITQRAQILADQGDRKGAMRVLQQAMNDATSPGLAGRFEADHQTMMRSHDRSRRRLVVIIVLLAVIVAVIAAWVLRAQWVPLLPEPIRESVASTLGVELAPQADAPDPAPTDDPEVTP